uniref:Uncharacterized protein n=1 Tax=Strongyloides stercoralis TaxID=6248 RepID=A0A0K0DZ98_STRER
MKYYYYTLLSYLKIIRKRFQKMFQSNFYARKLNDYEKKYEFSYQSFENEPLFNNEIKNDIENSHQKTITIQGITFKGDIDSSLLID